MYVLCSHKNFLRCFTANGLARLFPYIYYIQSSTMNKKILLLAFITSLSMASFAQTINKNIDKAAKDPATKENAAKADVRLHDKKIITDSSSVQPQKTAAIDKKKKKRSCKKSG